MFFIFRSGRCTFLSNDLVGLVSKTRQLSDQFLRKTCIAGFTKNKKNKFEESQFQKLNPKALRPGLFYRTPIVNEIQHQQQGERLKELTTRLIISNIRTITYKIGKYLNKLWTLLTKSEYNILNTEDLIRTVREERLTLDIK